MPLDFIYSAQPTELDRTSVDPISLPGRPLYLPPLYVYDGEHPQCPSRRIRRGKARAVVYFLDKTLEGRRQWSQLNTLMKIPVGRTDNLSRTTPGLFNMRPGDYLFARVVGLGGIASKDILQGFCAPSGFIPQSMLNKANRERDVVMGLRHERTSDRLHFESNPKLKPVRVGTRCYSLGESVQVQPKIGSPTAHNKVYNNTLTKYQQDTQRFLKTTMDIGTTAWELGAPFKYQEMLRDYHELINAPSVGNDRNYMWPSIQLNVAPAQNWNSSASLKTQMGFFGGEHTDDNDSVVGLSVMVCLSDIPDSVEWDAGRFHLLAVGVYWTLESGSAIFFTGRLLHGGTSPIAPSGYQMKGWEYRLVVIGYPSSKIQMGDIRLPLAALPFMKHPLYITPEMTGVSGLMQKPVFYTSRTNIAMDGQVIMRPRGQFKLYVRGILQLVTTLLGQLDLATDEDDPDERSESSTGSTTHDTRITIDTEMFLRSITLHRGGQQYHADNWRLAPGSDVRNPSTPEHKRVEANVVRTLYEHHAQGIPNATPKFIPEPKSADVGRPQGAKKPPDKYDKFIEHSDDSDEYRPAMNGVRNKSKLNARRTTVCRKRPVDEQLTGKLDESDTYRLSSKRPKNGADTCTDTNSTQAQSHLTTMYSKADQSDDLGSSSPDASRGEQRVPRSEWWVAVPESSLLRSYRRYDNDHTERDSLETDGHRSPCVSISEKDIYDHLDNVQKLPLNAIHSAPGVITTGVVDDIFPTTIQAGTSEESNPGDGFGAQFVSGRPHRISVDGNTNSEDVGGFLEEVLPPCESVSEDIALSSDADSSLSAESGSCLKPSIIHTRSNAGMAMRFFDAINDVSLQKAVDNVHLTREQLSASFSLSVPEVFNMLNYIDDEVNRQPQLPLHTLVHICHATNDLRRFCATTDVWLNVCRMRIMLSEHFISSYMRHFCTETIESFLTDTSRQPEHWIEHLAFDIYKCVERRNPLHLSSDKYVSVDVLPLRVYHSREHSNRKFLITSEEIISASVAHVKLVLADWLHFSDTYSTRARAHLVQMIWDAGVLGLLLLPDTWSVYDGLPRWLFDNEKPRVKDTPRRRVQFASNHMRNFKQALMASRFVDQLSPGYALLESLRAAYRRLTRSSDPSTSSATGPQFRIINNSLINDYPDTRCSETRWNSLSRVVTLLRVAYQVCEQSFDASRFDETNTLAITLCQATDFLLPLRSLSPSCSRINGRVGTGIRPVFARTDRGLFSVLVFRGIFYNSEALRYTSLTDLQVEFTHKDCLRRYLAFLHTKFDSDASICNPYAMTSQPTGRSEENLEDFWSAAIRSGWTELFASHAQISFPTAHHWVKSLKRAKSLPSLGDLGMYLVIADMCDIGVVAVPSPEEMGSVIHQLDRGGLQGLRMSGYLTAKSSSECDTIKAFTTFYTDVGQLLSEDERLSMKWNTVTAEHTLCKYKRLIKLRHL